MKTIDTRRKILEGAYNCFSRREYHEVKIADVALTAGVGKGTVYEYFASKQELYGELFHFMGDVYVEAIEEAIRQGGPVSDTLERLYLTHAGFHQKLMQSDHGVLLLEEMMSGRRHQDLYPLHERIRGLMTQIVRQGVGDGLFAPELDERMASLFLMTGLPCIVYGDQLENTQDNVRTMVSLALNGLIRR